MKKSVAVMISKLSLIYRFLSLPHSVDLDMLSPQLLHCWTGANLTILALFLLLLMGRLGIDYGRFIGCHLLAYVCNKTCAHYTANRQAMKVLLMLTLASFIRTFVSMENANPVVLVKLIEI